MNKDQMERAISHWYELYEEGCCAEKLHTYLGITPAQYTLYEEWDILPNEEIPVEKFLQLRSDMIRNANDADNYLSENRRYKECLEQLKSLMSLSIRGDEGWVSSDEIQSILDRNNV